MLLNVCLSFGKPTVRFNKGVEEKASLTKPIVPLKEVMKPVETSENTSCPTVVRVESLCGDSEFDASYYSKMMFDVQKTELEFKYEEHGEDAHFVDMVDGTNQEIDVFLVGKKSSESHENDFIHALINHQ